jgi:hypothetical protein
MLSPGYLGVASGHLSAECPNCIPLQHGKFYFAQDIAYADDFIAKCRRLLDLLTKTAAYSAATQCFGLKLAPEKFRAFCLNPTERKPTMITYGEGWTPTEVPLATIGTIKYLGSHQDLDMSGQTDVARIGRILTECVTRISSKHCSPRTMLTYIHSTLLPKLVYAGSFSPAPLSSFARYDNRLGQLMKPKLHLPAGMSNAIVYGSYHQGAMGIPILSEEFQLRKFDMFHNLQRSDTLTRNTLEAMAFRQLHMHGEHKDTDCTLKSSELYDTWMNSILEYLAQHNLQEKSLKHPHTTTSVDYAQVYALVSDSDPLAVFFEIVGWNVMAIYYIPWSLENSHTRLRSIATTTIMSGHNVKKASWEEASRWTHKVETANLSSIKKKCNSMAALLVPLSITRVLPPIAPSLLPHPVGIPNTLICTDGSWKRSFTGPLPGDHVTKVGAAVVILNDQRSVLQALRMSNIHEECGKRAYAQEFLGLTAASFIHTELPGSSIHSDCMAALVKVQGTCRQYPLRPYCTAITLSDGHRHWVRGHADNRKTRAELLPPEFGNIVADSVADGHHQYNWIELDHQSFRTNVRLSNNWLLWHNNTELVIEPLRQFTHGKDMIEYCDHKNTEAGMKIHHPEILRGLCNRSHLSMSSRGSINKLFFGKFDDDRPRLEDASKPREPCPCGCSNQLDNWTTNCQHLPTSTLRNDVVYKAQATLLDFPTLQSSVAAHLRSAEGYHIWRGRIIPSLANTLQSRTDLLIQGKADGAQQLMLKKIQKAMKKCLDVLVEGALQIRVSMNSREHKQSLQRKRIKHQRRAYLVAADGVPPRRVNTLDNYPGFILRTTDTSPLPPSSIPRQGDNDSRALENASLPPPNGSHLVGKRRHGSQSSVVIGMEKPTIPN